MTLPIASDGAASSERARLVARALESWRRRLVDLSRRNNLLYFRDLKTGSLDLSAAEPDALADLLGDRAVPVSRLAPATEPDALGRALTEIRRRAQANIEERGLSTLFVALHMATWTPPDEGRPPAAPVLLLPVEIEARGRDARTYALRRAGDIQVNLVLLQAIEEAIGVAIDPEALLDEDAEDGDAVEAPTAEPVPAAPNIVPEPPKPHLPFEAVVERLREAAGQLPGFDVVPRAVLGNFAFQKMAMVKDLREQADAFVQHDLIAALAGDSAGREAVLSHRTDIDPNGFDGISPEAEFFVMDADSSQQAVVYAALAGQDGVIQGPPGTGKSQTIVNLIASLAAQGKRVLFVAEKRAALDVVLRRLQVIGLGHLALDLHSADVSRRQVMQRIADALVTVRESLPVADESVHAPLIARRNQLNLHANRMKAPVPPSQMTVYDLQGELLRFPEEAVATTRWRDPDLQRLTDDVAQQVAGLLAEATGFGDLFLRSSPSPWNGANLPDGTAAREAKDAAAALANQQWPALRGEFARFRAAAGLPEPAAIDQLLATASLAEQVATIQQTWQPELFARDVASLARGLEPGAGNAIGAFFAGVFNGGYKSAAKEAKSLRKTPASTRTMLGELRAAAALQDEWNKLAPGVPIPALPDVSALTAAAGALATTVDGLAPRLGGAPLRTLSPAAFETTVNGLAADSLTPDRIPRLLEIEAAIEQAGAGAIVAELRRVQPPTELWAQVFRYAHLASLLERAQEHDSGIAGFNGRVHDRAVAEFCELDRQRLRVAVARVRRAHAERAIDAMNQFPDQDALVRKEANKKSRHLPLRKLLAQAPDVLTSLCPCWMASPLTVAQLLDTGRRYFDVVIFDEASQVLPEDAACSLVRARHAIVAGDSKQLPPTTFFAAGTDDAVGDDDDQVAGFESLLDMLRGFLEPWTLRWHYRSRDETLIAFSNRFIYDGQLVTFPGPGGPPVVRHELVTPTPNTADDEELDSVGAEVDRVVQLVIEHAETRPDETLGVIAMGIRHAKRVEDALDLALQSRPDLDAFFDQSKDERFFVKNLERVQGDERDAIILTVGYGKDRNGKLPYRFGPLLTEGGERRLNVAITRARRRVTVVSSFTHPDMDPGRSDARGVQLLREYLAYAASGGHEDTGGPSGNAGAATAFEQDVREVLEARGLQLVPHWGASTYRVDFAVRHPEDPERFVLAIECDGPNYQRVPTARDRDRLREQVLAGLGWRYHRIWSTDWYLRKEEEADRALRAYQEALAAADAPAASPAPPPPASPAATAAPPPPESSRGPRPRVRKGKAIDEYTQRELIALVQWIASDGRMRTDEELIDEMVDELGFSRRGSRIEAAIRWAIQAAGV